MALKHQIDEENYVDALYGYPCTNNPLDFKPDEEVCTPEEIEAWEADVDAVLRGEETRDSREGTVWGFDEASQAVVHIDRSRWGLGITYSRTGSDETPA